MLAYARTDADRIRFTDPAEYEKAKESFKVRYSFFILFFDLDRERGFVIRLTRMTTTTKGGRQYDGTRP